MKLTVMYNVKRNMEVLVDPIIAKGVVSYIRQGVMDELSEDQVFIINFRGALTAAEKIGVGKDYFPLNEKSMNVLFGMAYQAFTWPSITKDPQKHHDEIVNALLLAVGKEIADIDTFDNEETPSVSYSLETGFYDLEQKKVVNQCSLDWRLDNALCGLVLKKKVHEN